MNKGFIKALSLAGVFLVAVIVLEFVFNKSGEDLTTTMPKASLPVLYFDGEEEEINPLFAYTQKMNPIYTRDTITPLEGDLSLPIRIDTYGNKIKGISYEVRTLSSDRLIEDTKVDDIKESEGYVYVTLPIQNLLDKDAEYQLSIKVSLAKKDIYYYTRIIYSDDMHVKECVNFARDFHKKTFDRKNQAELTKYMEPNGTKTNDNLCNTTIHSSIDQLFWGKLEGHVINKVQVSVKEVKKEYSVIILSYVLGSTGKQGESQYYNVQEYYRIRYGSDRMFLLDFERDVNQIFQEDGDNYTEKGINLGIRSDNVNYSSNETGTIFGFVQEGDLWEYNNINNSLARVFSFRGFEEIDTRENNSQHSIRIIRVDETGSMDFIVYGYMNRGDHEGRVGISVYHYDSISNSIEELVWIPYTKSYQMMDEIVGQVLYVNDKNNFYIMSEGIIYKIDLAKKEKEILTKGTGEEWFCSSKDNSRLAWIEGGNPNEGKTLHLYDMSTEKEKIIRAGSGEYIRPLDFIGKDLIYGIAKKKQVVTGVSGITIFPMYNVKIVDMDGTVKKEYEKNNTYVTNVSTENYTIKLNRVKYSGDSYVKINNDTIMNMAVDSKTEAEQVTIYDDVREKLVVIQLSEALKNGNPNFLSAKMVAYTDSRTIELENTGEENYYYVYAKGRVMMITPTASEAVKMAAKETGDVVDDQGQYIWQQAKSVYRDTLSGMKADTAKVGNKMSERALSVILRHEGITLTVGDLLDSGRTTKEILVDTLQDATVLDLSGCSLEQMLYYVSQGTPVYAMENAKKPVLICGYTKTNIVVYDPSTNQTRSIAMKDATKTFKKAGNIFLAYVNKAKH